MVNARVAVAGGVPASGLRRQRARVRGRILRLPATEFFGTWRYHVGLTPVDDVRKTRLWAHYEQSAFRSPVRDYNADGGGTDRGVREIASLFASDERFEASEGL